MKGSGFPSPRIQSWNTHSFWKGQTWESSEFGVSENKNCRSRFIVSHIS